MLRTVESIVTVHGNVISPKIYAQKIASTVEGWCVAFHLYVKEACGTTHDQLSVLHFPSDLLKIIFRRLELIPLSTSYGTDGQVA